MLSIPISKAQSKYSKFELRNHGGALSKMEGIDTKDTDISSTSNISIGEVKTHPDTVKFQQLRDSLSQEARHAFGSIKNAKAQGSIVYQLYKAASDAL
jgi:hypothetical protein